MMKEKSKASENAINIHHMSVVLDDFMYYLIFCDIWAHPHHTQPCQIPIQA